MTARVPEWTIGDRLRKARLSVGLDQGDIAAFTGLARTTIASYEQAQRPVRVGVVRLWAQRCGVSFSWLWSGTVDHDDDEAFEALIRNKCFGAAA